MQGALGTLGLSLLICSILDEIVGIGQSFLPCTAGLNGFLKIGSNLTITSWRFCWQIPFAIWDARVRRILLHGVHLRRWKHLSVFVVGSTFVKLVKCCLLNDLIP